MLTCLPFNKLIWVWTHWNDFLTRYKDEDEDVTDSSKDGANMWPGRFSFSIFWKVESRRSSFSDFICRQRFINASKYSKHIHTTFINRIAIYKILNPEYIWSSKEKSSNSLLITSLPPAMRTVWRFWLTMVSTTCTVNTLFLMSKKYASLAKIKILERIFLGLQIFYLMLL